MKKIRNAKELLARGDVESRRMVLSILEQVLQRMDSYNRIKDIAKLDGDVLQIGTKKINLQEKKRIFLLGAGKACNSMARAVEDILGDRITKGIIIVKVLEPTEKFKYCEVVCGGHPLPNEEGLKAAEAILELVEQADANDLFISVISGGSSALMSCPVQSISLEEELKVTDLLLKCGANINEINAVRRHISQVNGGRLAEKILAKRAELINFIISDSVGAKPTADRSRPCFFQGTPVARDQTTIKDALNTIKKYRLAAEVPKAIMDYLEAEDESHETPKELEGRVSHFVLDKVPDSCEVAAAVAREMGIPSMTLTTYLEGESREAGIFLASVAREIQTNHRPLATPCVLLLAGETTTKIEKNEKCGKGGPSQELALGFALKAELVEGVCLGALDTDGTDGPTDAAGAIADAKTAARARSIGLDMYKATLEHSSHSFFDGLGDCLYTGTTGTNVCDLNVLYIPNKREA
ncbi:MOFRL family [Acididesulfobacillus acetoxydans]|uniref:Glycerate 2-kinase n=1 Tax=Acididesulfobacillus acetoxydans TaxID=1561005 RepID=A0A8S0X4L3_9FIRM|nr:DUF4147 domain-containing protein [Acididesulfobacillus acetoxydans]CAA7600880.1 MOFRL family [Acididesulfobacillus acetoxydans]CEJ07924.1 Glycerate 2-kinase [Acididesulfobacillus acetoxydans]